MTVHREMQNKIYLFIFVFTFFVFLLLIYFYIINTLTRIKEKRKFSDLIKLHKKVKIR